jgi:hypothetical protein
MAVVDLRQCTKPVVLQFEQPVLMVEGAGDPNERHGPDVGVHTTRIRSRAIPSTAAAPTWRDDTEYSFAH